MTAVVAESNIRPTGATPIAVTAEDVADGSPCDGGRCPIQRALTRCLPLTGLLWFVTCSYAVKIPDTTYRNDLELARAVMYGRSFKLPPAAQEFIRRHTWGWHVEPFQFELPEQTIA